MAKHARVLVIWAALLAAVVWAAPEAPKCVVRSLEAVDGATGPVVRLLWDHEVEYVAYSPSPGIWFVELPADLVEVADLEPLEAPLTGIKKAYLERTEEFGKKLVRLVVELDEPWLASVKASSSALELAVEKEQEAAPPGMPVASEDLPVADQGESQTTPDASNLLGLALEEVNGFALRMVADGSLQGKAFVLHSPERLVVDLPGVVCRVRDGVMEVGSSGVARVRVAQFKGMPDPVTRVVLDFEGEVPEYRLEPSEGGLLLVLGSSEGQEQVAEASALSVEVPQAQQAEMEEATAPEAELAEAQAAPQADEVVSESEVAEASSQVYEEEPYVERAVSSTVIQEVQPGFETKEVQSEEKRFTGEPISLHLKDADIKDVLKTFATITGLNVVVHPDVTGSVTVELDNVPWDQALDLILKINGLGYVLENNVLRVAPMGALAAEKQQLEELRRQREKAQPMKLVWKPLSYAQAEYVKNLIQEGSYLLSDRGSVVVDKRTNTLIIRDTVDRVEAILRLVDMIDQPTPQVLIEARIVETTRDFSHTLGLNWGFRGAMDPEHGNETGWTFPSSVEFAGGVSFGATQFDPNTRLLNYGSIGFSFGDVLGAFNLDFMLTAAESDGLIRIVSTPQVVAQNMQEAEVRSGLQLPVQTVANNTVTVQYIDASLKLTVTPQVTAEGTIMLDIDIKKREPAMALVIPGAPGAPIFTRDAKTQVLVRDGGTTVIAGIYQLNDQTSEDRVPGLSKIPVIGSLFKTKTIKQRHDELLIFITPRIIKY